MAASVFRYLQKARQGQAEVWSQEFIPSLHHEWLGPSYMSLITCYLPASALAGNWNQELELKLWPACKLATFTGANSCPSCSFSTQLPTNGLGKQQKLAQRPLQEAEHAVSSQECQWNVNSLPVVSSRRSRQARRHQPTFVLTGGFLPHPSPEHGSGRSSHRSL